MVVEELLQRTAHAKAFTDSSSALAIATGDTGSWRTRHLRRRALSLRWRVTRGDWLIRHIPGTEMPADLGTKPLSFEKFAKFKEMMGMCTKEKEKEEVQKLEKGSENQHGQALKRVSTTANMNVKKALTAVLLIAQVAMSKAQGSEDSGYYDLGSLDVIVIWVVIPLIVALIAILAMHRMNLAELRKRSKEIEDEVERKVQERVKGLEIQVEEHIRKETGLRRRTQASSSSSFAPLPREIPDHHAPQPSEESPEDATSSAAGHRAADGAAGRSAADGAAGRSAADGAAGRSAADGAAGHCAAYLAAEVSNAAADAERAASHEVAPRPVDSQVGSSNNLPRLSFHPDSALLYVTPTGTKYHTRRSCYGLRNATRIFVADRCPQCGPVQVRPKGTLYRGNAGDLHTQRFHAVLCDGEAKELGPCRACDG